MHPLEATSRDRISLAHFSRMLRRIANVAAPLVALAASASGGVFVVDVGGLGTRTDLPAAVAAAADGDLLLVKAGAYSGFTIDNKALDIVAEAGVTPEVLGPIAIRNLAATRAVSVTGLRVRQLVQPASPTAEPALAVTASTGAVRLQGLDLQGFDGILCGAVGGHSLSVFNSFDVVATRCTLQGGNGAPLQTYYSHGGHGVVTQNARIALYQCTVVAGHGGDGSPACGPFIGYGYAGYGGEGVRSYGAEVFAAGCSIQGGDGGSGLGPLPAGCGGTAITALTSSSPSRVRLLDCTLAQGAPGGGSAWLCTTPTPVTFVTPRSWIVTLAGSARKTSAPRVLRENQILRVDFEGQPGDVVELRFATQARYTYSDAWRGVLALRHASPWPALHAGVLDGNGRLSIAWPSNDLGIGVDSTRLFLQASFLDASGITTLGPPTSVCLLDSAY